MLFVQFSSYLINSSTFEPVAYLIDTGKISFINFVIFAITKSPQRFWVFAFYIHDGSQVAVILLFDFLNLNVMLLTPFYSQKIVLDFPFFLDLHL